MGDYTKLIVDAVVIGVTKEEVEAKIAELRPGSSYYHATGTFHQVRVDDTFPDRIEVSMICQTKYSRGQEEFLKWMQPFVTDGSGEREIWATQIWEQGKPKYWALNAEYRCQFCGRDEAQDHSPGCPIKGWS